MEIIVARARRFIGVPLQQLFECHELPYTRRHCIEHEEERPVLKRRQLDLLIRQSFPDLLERGERPVDASVATFPCRQHPPILEPDDKLARNPPLLILRVYREADEGQIDRDIANSPDELPLRSREQIAHVELERNVA